MTDKNKLVNLKELAKKGIASIDVDEIKLKAKETTDTLVTKAAEVKDAAIQAKEDITDKLTELDRNLSATLSEYNETYTLMNDKGVQLFVERKRALDTLSFVESIVKSIANIPKEFDKDYKDIHTNRKQFTDSCEDADLELKAVRSTETTAGAGLTAGMSVALMSPTAAFHTLL